MFSNDVAVTLDIGDIFSEVGDIQPSLPPKLGAQRNTPTPTSGLVAIPRPASRPRPEVRKLISFLKPQSIKI